MFVSLFAQILVLLVAAVLCGNVMGRPSKMKDDCSFSRQKPSVGILRIRYFLFGDDSFSQEELELSDLFKQEPTAGRDKTPPSRSNEQKRPPDQMGQLNPMRPSDRKENQPTAKAPVPIPREGQINPQNQENPVNPTMVNPPKTDVPLPDESMHQLEQEKMKDPENVNPNPPAFPPGQSSQMREPISEDKDRKQEPLEQLNAPKILEQQKSQLPEQQPQQQQLQQPQQQAQQQPFQLQQGPRQEFQPQKQQPQLLQQQLQQDELQQPQQEFQPQQQQPRAMERRKRFQPIRQFPSGYDDSYSRYWPDSFYPRVEEVLRQANLQRYFGEPTGFQGPATNMDLRVQDDKSGYNPLRNDGGVDIELNV